ncbi:MAG: hypothetical protein WBF53_02620 [Litorimonas sp.]
MKRLLIAAALIAIASTPAFAQASRMTDQPGNCAIYAEMLAKTIKADARVTGTAESEAVETLGKFEAYLNSLVEAGMADTYKQAAAYGMDKASVDQRMEAGQKALRDGFVGPTMEPDKVYTDHLLAVNDCAEKAKRRGELGQADVEKLATRMNAVFRLIY